MLSLHRTFWWLWSSLIATVISLIVLQSWILTVPSLLSSGWALQYLLQLQVIVADPNDLDLEMQPLEQAGIIPQRRTNMTLGQAFRQAFASYMHINTNNRNIT